MNAQTFLKLCFDPALICNRQGEIIEVNSSLEKESEFSKQELNNISQLLADWQPEDLSEKLERHDVYFSHFDLLTKEGCKLKAVFNASYAGEDLILLCLRVENEEVQDEDENFLAFHDPLTKLPNRRLLQERITAAVHKCKVDDEQAAIIFIDLDEFKPINDNFGHECGDNVLVTSGQRMQSLVRDTDTVARIGGDEFIVLLTRLKAGVHAGLTAKRIINKITLPIDWNERQVKISASVGISVIPKDGHEPEDLLSKADAAMYVAKKSGKNGYSFHDESSYY